jgi:hypothetical protein
MTESWVERIREVPAEEFRRQRASFADLTPGQRLRWLEQTAYFVWKHKGAARRPNGERRSRCDDRDRTPRGRA